MTALDDLLEEDGDHLLYLGPVDKHGVGRRKQDGKTRLIHAIVWEADHGPVPDGQVLARTCTEWLCVAPVHRELVTRDELASRRRSGKGRPFAGEPGPVDGAECAGVDPKIFLNPAHAKEARGYCRRCPVVAACNEWAERTAVRGVMAVGIFR